MTKVYTCSLHDYTSISDPCPRCGLLGRLTDEEALGMFDKPIQSHADVLNELVAENKGLRERTAELRRKTIWIALVAARKENEFLREERDILRLEKERLDGLVKELEAELESDAPEGHKVTNGQHVELRNRHENLATAWRHLKSQERLEDICECVLCNGAEEDVKKTLGE